MDILYEAFTPFLIITLVLGGLAAWKAGIAIAEGWQPIWILAAYMTLLGGAVRFFHFALAEGTLLSLYYYAVDTVILIAIAALAFRVKRASQMVTQYPWLYRRTGPLTWADR